MAEVTEPGVYELPADVYHADPVPEGSLSSTGARRLLPPSCPAMFDYLRSNPEQKRAYDLGHAAHDRLIGGGPEIVVVDADSWRTNAAKAAAADARERGAVPILAAENDQVDAMVAAVRAHPFAGRLFENGTPEPSLFWRDEETKVWRRARPDFLPHRPMGSGRLIVPDFKTCVSAERDQFAKAAMNYGYHQQAPWYVDGIKALGIADEVAFVFVAVEKTPPYLVNVIQLDVAAMRIGAALNRRAISIFAQCQDTGVWPGYSDDVQLASLPAWYERQHEEEI